MNKKNKIAIYDSGAGGLSITTEILKRRLDCDIIYVADSKKFPYGELSEQELEQRALATLNYLDNKFKISTFIVACNTASTSVLPALRRHSNTSIIGVVPAIKPAAKLSLTGEIGVLATSGTVSREYLDDLITQHAASSMVYRYGSGRLVEIAEKFIQTGRIDIETVERELEILLSKSTKIDVVILACTHFPLLEKALSPMCKRRNIKLIDSTHAIVNRLQALNNDLIVRENNEEEYTDLEFLHTGSEPTLAYQRYLEEIVSKEMNLTLNIRLRQVDLDF